MSRIVTVGLARNTLELKVIQSTLILTSHICFSLHCPKHLTTTNFLPFLLCTIEKLVLFLCIGPDAGHQLLIRRHGRVDFLRQAYLWGIARYFLLRQILHPLNLLNSLRQPATPTQNACHPVLRVPLCLRVLNRTIGSSDPAFINLEI